METARTLRNRGGRFVKGTSSAPAGKTQDSSCVETSQHDSSQATASAVSSSTTTTSIAPARTRADRFRDVQYRSTSGAEGPVQGTSSPSIGSPSASSGGSSPQLDVGGLDETVKNEAAARAKQDPVTIKHNFKFAPKNLPPKHDQMSFIKAKATHKFSKRRRARNLCFLVITVVVISCISIAFVYVVLTLVKHNKKDNAKHSTTTLNENNTSSVLSTVEWPSSFSTKTS